MKISAILLFIFSIIALGVVVYADNSCVDDIQKYCSGVQPGGGRIKDCLMDHYKEVSEDYYNALSQGKNNQENGN